MFKKITDKEYFAIDACSASMLKQISAKSVLHAVLPQKEPSESMIIGSAFHCFALEPHLFNDRYAVYPETINGEKPDYRKTEHKRFREHFEAKNEGKDKLSFADYNLVQGMVSSLKSTKLYSQFLGVGQPEMTIVKEEGEPECVKIKMDWVNTETHTIVDLKKCQSAAPSDIRRDIYKFGYDIQAAFYSLVYHAETGEKPSFIFCFVEENYPHAVSWVTLSPAMLADGLNKVSDAYKKYLEYRATGEAKGYSEDLVEIA